MPKRREAGFRKIFAAPAGQLVMALDYSQIELRAVGELISDWFGYRQHLAAVVCCWHGRPHRYGDVDDRQESPGGCH